MALGLPRLSLQERDSDRVGDKVGNGEGEQFLPAQPHHLVVAEPRHGPAYPHEDEDRREHLAQKDRDRGQSRDERMEPERPPGQVVQAPEKPRERNPGEEVPSDRIVASTLPKRIAIEASPATSGWSQSAHPVRWCRPPRSRASEIPGKRFHPPRKRSANTADPTIMLAYSATKNRDHLKAPYSVWNPPTRSASDSGMSKGWRFVSANRATAKTRAETGMVNRNHAPPQNPGRLWNSTTRARLSGPAVPGSLTQRNTGSTASTMESS